MSVSRREILGGAALIGAVGTLGVRRMIQGAKPQVVIYEGDRPASHALARTGGAARSIDLAAERHSHWRSLRALGKGEVVAGFTSWSAYVAARGLLEEKGLRIVSEVLDRRRGLVAWAMA